MYIIFVLQANNVYQTNFVYRKTAGVNITYVDFSQCKRSHKFILSYFT